MRRKPAIFTLIFFTFLPFPLVGLTELPSYRSGEVTSPERSRNFIFWVGTSRLTPHASRSFNPSPSTVSKEEVIGITANLDSTLTLFDGRNVTFSGKYYRHERKVRFEPERGSGLRKEVEVLDFGRKVLYRIFPDDKIYFEIRLSSSRLNKMVREGWVPTPEEWKEERILLREIVLEGHQAKLYLLVQRRPSVRGEEPRADHALLWMEKEFEVPLRLVYTDPQGHPVMINFREIALGPIDAALFKPPPNYSNLSPF